MPIKKNKTYEKRIYYSLSWIKSVLPPWNIAQYCVHINRMKTVQG